MGSNIIELAKLGHDRAAELKASCGAVDVRSVAQLISDLATQLEVQLVRGNEQAVQLTNAESKCRELVAENATMKEVTSDVMKHVYRSKTYLDSNRVVDAIQGLQCAIERKAGKTPATDAFLTEVRAQGVEMVISYHRERADALHHVDRSNAIRHSMSALDASDVAAQLRKGASA
ncbi:hypothetical protein U2U97_002931 [Escherichia coli]|nr:hypothetical protein [Escherichia coli]EMA3831261.1 hypothetical protein [Escherichia coli]EMC8292755.1 hypothetical protein [Escherichia coli]